MRRFYIQWIIDEDFEITTCNEEMSDDVPEAPTHYIDIDDDKIVGFKSYDWANYNKDKLQRDINKYRDECLNRAKTESEREAEEEIFSGLFENKFNLIDDYFGNRYAAKYVFDEMESFCKRFGYNAWQYSFDGINVVTYFVSGTAVALNKKIDAAA